MILRQSIFLTRLFEKITPTIPSVSIIEYAMYAGTKENILPKIS